MFWKAQRLWPQIGLCVWQHLGDTVGKVAQQYLGGLECKDKNVILSLVGIEELGSIWTGYYQSYNLERLIWVQDNALVREGSRPVRVRLQWQSKKVIKACIKVI